LKQVLASIISNDEIMPGVYLIWLKAPQITSSAQPGQFVMVRCGEEHDLPLRRPLSIHQIDGNKLAILFNLVGKGTQWLSQRQTGDTLDLLGALGNGFSINPTSHTLLLLAGGIGIAPLCFLSQQALEQGHSVTMLHGASTATHLYLKDIPTGIKLITATEDGSVGTPGLVTSLLPDFINEADQVFACGPLGMYKDMSIRRGKLLKDKPTQVSLEVRMGCGLGVCYGCTIKTKNGLKQVCRDGPVFNMDDILWEELNLMGF